MFFNFGEGIAQKIHCSSCSHRELSNGKTNYNPPGKFFPPFLQMSLRGRSSRSNPRLPWETASFLAVTSHLDYWKKLFWTAIFAFDLLADTRNIFHLLFSKSQKTRV
jgi:hypothetical protein